MLKKIRIVTLLLILLLIIAGCGKKEAPKYSGIVYPPTSEVKSVFQPGQVSKVCRIFAEVLVSLPANSTGKGIHDYVITEAGLRGAEMVLIGQSRESEDDDGPVFHYFGPDKEYLCSEKWCGWKGGYDLWAKQGDWVNIGLNEWGNGAVFYDYPIVMQVAYLRCR